MGFLGKGEGRGLGLSKVADILNRYPKVNLETRSCDHHFTQVLSFQDIDKSKILFVGIG